MNEIRGMQIIKDAAAKTEKGSITDLQQELAGLRAKISAVALNNAATGQTKALQLEILCALVKIAYNGDWAKAGKVIESEFAPWKKK